MSYFWGQNENKYPWMKDEIAETNTTEETIEQIVLPEKGAAGMNILNFFFLSKRPGRSTHSRFFTLRGIFLTLFSYVILKYMCVVLRICEFYENIFFNC